MTVVGTAEIVAHMNTSLVEGELKAGTAPAFAAFEEQSKVAGRVAGAELAAGMRSGSVQLMGEMEVEGTAASRAMAAGVAKGKPAIVGEMASMGKGGGAAFAGAAAVAVTGYAVHLGLEMQKADTAIANHAQISQTRAKHIGDAFLDTAGKAEFSGKQMADAFAPVAGQLKTIDGRALSAADSTKVMLAAADLASAKQIDLGSATKATAGIMQAYGLSAKDAGHVTDVLFASSNATGQSVDQVAGSLEKTRAKLGSAAGSLTDVSGLMVEMTSHGVTGRAALSAVSGALTSVTSASEHGSKSQAKTAAELKHLGIEAFDAHGKFIGMGAVIQQLAPKFAGMSQQQRLAAASTIFGAGAAKSMLQVVQAGPAAYDKARDSVKEMGSAHEAAEKQAHTLEGEMGTLKAQVSDIGTKIGEVLIPILTKLVGWFIDVIKYVVDLKDHWRTLGAILVAPFALAGAAAILMEKKVAGVFTTVEGAATNAWGTIKHDGKAAWDAIGGAAGNVVGDVKGAFGDVISTVEHMPDRVASAAKNMFDGIWQAFRGALNLVINAWDSLHFSVGGGKVSLPWPLSDVHIPKITIGVPHIPTLADGGVATSSVFANVGEAGHEAILPLTTQTYAQLGKGISDAQVHSGGLSSTGTASTILSFFMGKGLSRAQSAGIVGNLQQESGLNASSPGGYLAQWGGDRLRGLESYAQQQGKSVTDLSVQLQYMWKELTSTQSTSLAALRGTHTAAQAAVSFSNNYERPLTSAANLPARQRYANEAAGLAGSSSGHTTTHTVKVKPSDEEISAWAKSMIGHFAESTGSNTGPELDKLQAEFHTRAAAWCAEFATTAAVMGGAHKAVRTASVDRIAQWATAGTHGYHKGLSGTAHVGDEALLHGSDGYHGHVGFVVAVNKKAGTFTTEEGNTNQGDGSVRKVVHKLSDNEGFARPIYASVSKVSGAAEKALKDHTAAVKAWLAQEAIDSKAGQSQLANMVTATHSHSLAFLNHELDATHERALRNTEVSLIADGTKASLRLEQRLVAAHTAALKEQTKLQAIANQKAAEEFYAAWNAALDQQHADTITTQASRDANTASFQVRMIQDATKVQLDQLGEGGKAGADAVAAHAQTVLDQTTYEQDWLVRQFQVVVDNDQNASKSQQATDAANLAAAQNAASILEAQQQSAVDIANATAQIADAAAQTTDTAGAPTDTSGGATTTTQANTFNFTINGHGMSASDLMDEIGWALKTGTLPPPAPIPVGA